MQTNISEFHATKQRFDVAFNHKFIVLCSSIRDLWLLGVEPYIDIAGKSGIALGIFFVS